MPRLDRLWYVIDAETKGFDEGVVKSGEKLRSFTEYASGHPMVVLGALGAAAIVAGYKMTQMAADFEKSMKMVQTVTDTTQASMADLSNGVLKTFEALPITSLDEMTKGLYDIISSGVPAGDAINYLNVAAKAAVGGVTSVAVAVDGLTSATNAWAGQGLTVTQASDEMFQAVNKGKMTFEQLASSIGTVSAMAAGVGVPLSDVLAVVAQLTLNGMSASEAMTSVRAALTNIVKPTGILQTQFPDLARQFTRAKLEGEGLVGFLLDFNKATNGNGAAMTAMFSDIQALSGVMGLLRDGGVGVAQMLDDVKHSEGAASEAARIMGSSAVDTEQTLKNKLHAELVRGGTVVLPVWMAAIKGATALLKAYNDEANNTRQLDFAKDVAGRAPGFAASGGGNGNDARKMRNDLVDLYEDIKNGAVDTSKLTTDELRNIQKAFAADLAQSAGLTVQEFEQQRAQMQRLSGGRVQPADNLTAGYDYVTLLTQKRQREEDAAAAAAKKDADARIAGLAHEGTQLAQVATASAKAAESYKGMGDEASRAQNARAGALTAIADAERQISEAQTKLNTAVASHDEAGAKAALTQLHAAQTQINDQHQVLTTAGEQLTQAAKRAASSRAQLLAAADEFSRGGQKSPVEEAESRIRTLVTEARNAHVALADIDSAVERIREGAKVIAARDAAALVRDAQAQLIQLTGTAVEQARTAGDEQIRQLSERVTLSRELNTSEKATLTTMLDQMRASLAQKVAFASVQQQLDAITQRDAQNPNIVDLHEFVDLNALELKARQTLTGLRADTDAYKNTQAQILGIQQRRVDLMNREASIEKEIRDIVAKFARDETARITDQAQGLQQIVGMATQLAQAFGLMGTNLVQSLNSVAQIATSVQPLLKEIKNLNVVDGSGNPLATFGSVIGKMLPIAGGIATLVSSLFNQQEDPAVVAARNANTEALKELTRHIGDLSKSSVSGASLGGANAGASAAIAKVEADIQRLLDTGKMAHDAAAINEALRRMATIDKQKVDLSDPKLAAAIAAAGSSVKELQDVAQALGITITTVGDLKKLLDAMKTADLAAYTDTFAGSMQRLQDQFRAYGITDPTEKLRRTIAALTAPTTGIPALATALSGIDTTTADGAAKAITNLQQLLDGLGNGSISASALGGASIDETRQAILDLIDELRGDSSGTGGFNVSQQITEVTGSRLVAIADTSRIFLEQISGNTALLAQYLTGAAVVAPILPPAAPVTALANLQAKSGTASDAGQGAITIGDIVVHLNAEVDDERALAIGKQVGTGVVDSLDRALGTQLQWRARGRGTVTR